MRNNTYSRFKLLKSMFHQAPLKPIDFEELKTLAQKFDRKFAEYLNDGKTTFVKN